MNVALSPLHHQAIKMTYREQLGSSTSKSLASHFNSYQVTHTDCSILFPSFSNKTTITAARCLISNCAVLSSADWISNCIRLVQLIPRRFSTRVLACFALVHPDSRPKNHHNCKVRCFYPISPWGVDTGRLWSGARAKICIRRAEICTWRAEAYPSPVKYLNEPKIARFPINFSFFLFCILNILNVSKIFTPFLVVCASLNLKICYVT